MMHFFTLNLSKINKLDLISDTLYTFFTNFKMDFLAVQNGDLEVVKLWINAGADVNEKKM